MNGNEIDIKLLRNDLFLSHLANSIADGIIHVFELKKEGDARQKDLVMRLESENKELKLTLRKIAMETAKFLVE